jgi:lipopolysaccharide/colanic/teichoic acid biosynthesis glycosyltransferase/GGDEF domain-containing protein
MSRFRILLLILVLWLIFIYNLERPDFDFIGLGNVDLDSGVYIITGLISMAILILPDLAKRYEVALIPTLVIYAVSRFAVGNPVTQSSIYLTITEIVVLAVTVWIARKISLVISDFEQTVEDVLLKPDDLNVLDKDKGEEKINNELSRARYFDHTVGFLLIHMSSFDQAEDLTNTRFDMEGALQRRYVQLRVAQVARSILPKISILVWDEDDLVICLPETGYAATEQLARALYTKLALHLNLTIPMGIAVFPKDGLIYHDLVQATMRNMLDFGDSAPDDGEEPPSDTPQSTRIRTTPNAVMATPKADMMTIAKAQWRSIMNPLPRVQGLTVKPAGGDSNLYDPNFWLHELPYQSITSRSFYQIVKRIIDIIVVVASFPVTLPAMGLIALLIKATDGGSIVFKQERTGFGGRRFKMYKFRSMVEDAEELLKDLAAKGLAVLDEKGKLAEPLKLDPDPRITRIGRILRKTSLDELPQIFNVLNGDMSLVGPRPTSWGLNRYQLKHTERLNVRPGLTGLWQISARGNTDFDIWLQWDNAYIDKMSFLLDMQILVRTVGKVMKRKGAR